VTLNPCAGADRPEAGSTRDRVLTTPSCTDELRWFWMATDSVGEPFGTVLKLLLLTGQRLSEVAGLSDRELSPDLATWNLSGSRTKNGLAHVVPLPPLTRELIAAVPRVPGSHFVFSTTGRTPVSGWSRTKKRLDRLMHEAATREGSHHIPPWRIHDLRRTFVTGARELGIRPDVIELTINHISGHRAGVAGIYDKSELMPERKAALERWTAHVHGLVWHQPDNVVALRKARRGQHK
jgi:integrase